MIHDFRQKRVYRLVTSSIWPRFSGWRRQHEKARYSKASAREAAKARAAAKNNTTDTLPAPAKRPLLLCQSKLRTGDVVLRLALGEAGVLDKHRDNGRTAARHAALRKAGKRPAPFRPKVYENVVPQLRLRTSQAGLAMTCGCDVRTIQRHLTDFEGLGFVVHRQQLAPDRHRSECFQLVLNADFLEWQEIRVNQDGTTFDQGANSSPVAASVPPSLVSAPPAGPEPPGSTNQAPDGLAAMTALRQKFSSNRPASKK